MLWNFFSLSLMLKKNELECLSLACFRRLLDKCLWVRQRQRKMFYYIKTKCKYIKHLFFSMDNLYKCTTMSFPGMFYVAPWVKIVSKARFNRTRSFIALRPSLNVIKLLFFITDALGIWARMLAVVIFWTSIMYLIKIKTKIYLKQKI